MTSARPRRRQPKSRTAQQVDVACAGLVCLSGAGLAGQLVDQQEVVGRTFAITCTPWTASDRGWQPEHGAQFRQKDQIALGRTAACLRGVGFGQLRVAVEPTQGTIIEGVRE